ncbi:hypothetical protein U1Q18_017068 [Sarracenia purpurea var. burkii]
MGMLGQKETQKETRSINTAYNREENVTGRRNLTSLTKDLAKDCNSRGRNLGKEVVRENLGGSRDDNWRIWKLQDNRLSQHSANSEPKYVLGQVLESPLNVFEESAIQEPDPVDEVFTRDPLASNRVSEEQQTIRAPNWKRRARGAKKTLTSVTCDADQKKRKMGDGERTRNGDERDQSAGQKKAKTDNCDGGMFLNLDTVEAEIQPHRAP